MEPNFTVAFCVISWVIIYMIFSVILKFVKRREFYQQASKFPGPPTLPIIGNAHMFTGSNEEIFYKFINLSQAYPSPYRLWIGGHLLLYVTSSEQLKAVFLSPKTITKGDLMDFAQPWLGTGLLTAAEEKWRVHRKLIQPTFRLTILQSFLEVFTARSIAVAKDMEHHSDGTEFEIYKYLFHFTLLTICETTLGVDIGTQKNGNDLYADIIEKTADGICRRVVSPWLHPNFIFERTQLGKDQQKYIKFLHDFTDGVIRTKQKQLLEQNHLTGPTENKEDNSNRMPRKKALLDHLIELSGDGKILSDKALREEVDTIVVAGSETTATISSYAMLMLASHPEVQEKVYEELWEIYKGIDIEERHVDPQDLPRMTYLERVIKETMRLFPIAPFLIRLVTEDLDIGDRTFPKGSLVVLSLIELHRSKDYWTDSLKFDPDRFLPEEVKKRDPFTYLPFSGGPRNCIGAKYAMMSMKVLLSTILRRYVLKKENIEPIGDIRLKWEFLLKPANPITLRIEKRT